MSTAVPSAAVAVKTDEQPSELRIELLDGSIVTLRLGNWDIDVLLEGTYRRGYFKATDGVYYAASQIKKSVAK